MSEDDALGRATESYSFFEQMLSVFGTIGNTPNKDTSTGKQNKDTTMEEDSLPSKETEAPVSQSSSSIAAQQSEPPPWLATLLSHLSPTIQATANSHKRQRLPDPDMFDGTRSKFAVFEQQLTAKVENDKEDFENDKIAVDYAYSRMKGSGAALVLPYIRTSKASGKYNFDAFLHFLKAMFGDQHEEERARDRLMSMKQGQKSIRTYVMDFNEQLLLSKGGLNEGMKITIFRKGLSVKLQDKLISIDCIDIDNLQSQAIKISDQLYRMELSTGRLSGNNKSGTDKKIWTFAKKSKGKQEDSEDEMEDIVFTGKTHSFQMSQDTYKELRREGRCFGCKRKGHMASACPRLTNKSSKRDKPNKVTVTKLKTGEHQGKPVKLLKSSKKKTKKILELSSEDEGSTAEELVFTSEDKEDHSGKE